MSEVKKTRRVKINPYVPVFDNLPLVPANLSNLAFVDNTVETERDRSVTVDGDFVYTAGRYASFHKGNLAFVHNFLRNGNPFTGNEIQVDNNFAYMISLQIQGNRIHKFHKNNAAFIQQTSINWNGGGTTLAMDDDFLYTGGNAGNQNSVQRVIRKFHKSNLGFIGNTNSQVTSDKIKVDANFIYSVASGLSQGTGINKFHKGNLQFVAVNTSFKPLAIDIDDNFIYVGGSGDYTVRKHHKSNLVLAGNTNSHNDTIFGIAVSNNFIYAGSRNNEPIKKWHAGNLVFVGETVPDASLINAITVADNFIYAVGASTTLRRYQDGTPEIPAQDRIIFNENTYTKEEI